MKRWFAVLAATLLIALATGMGTATAGLVNGGRRAGTSLPVIAAGPLPLAGFDLWVALPIAALLVLAVLAIRSLVSAYRDHHDSSRQGR